VLKVQSGWEAAGYLSNDPLSILSHYPKWRRIPQEVKDDIVQIIPQLVETATLYGEVKDADMELLFNDDIIYTGRGAS
jgi:hypothetical protein